MTEEALAAHLQATLAGAENWDLVSRKRLAHRLSSIEAGPEREVHQFRALQQAARECAPLVIALDAAGLLGLTGLDTRKVAPTTGALIQAFNRLIESGWGPCTVGS